MCSVGVIDPYVHCVSEKARDHILYNNLNSKCPITIIFGTFSRQTMRHRKMVLFPTSPSSTVQHCTSLGNHRTQKGDNFSRKQHVVLWIKNVKQYFIYTQVISIQVSVIQAQVLKMSSLCMHALPQSLSPLADSQVNDSLLQIIPSSSNIGIVTRYPSLYVHWLTTLTYKARSSA